MDKEKDIQIAAQRLCKDNDMPMIRALSMLLSKYQCERRFEEAEIVRKLIEPEKPQTTENGKQKADITTICDLCDPIIRS